MAGDRRRVVNALFLPALGPAPERGWQPPVDVYRVPDGWLLKFELAGVAPEDISVRVEGSRVVVRGSRIDRCREPGCRLHQLEITYSTFERSVELPDDLRAATIGSEFQYGMVIVHIHKGQPR
jgi:HSP20 family protein